MSEPEPNAGPSGRQPGPPSFYRAAALEAHHGASEAHGRPLALVSSWTRWTVRVCVLALLVGLVFVSFAPVSEYAEGPAMIRRSGRSVVSSTVPGTVQAIEVAVGDAVVAGQVLVRLDDLGQRSALDQAEHDYEARLVELLREPSDAAARDRVARAGEDLARARAALRERSLVAAVDGRVSDLRVRLGQAVGLGDVVAAVDGDAAEAVIVGVLPGHVRPLLERRQTPLSVELDGFPDSRRRVELRAVADEIIGPAEALRVLGSDQQGAVELHGPLVLVEARLSGESFESEGQRYRVYDGMPGRIEAQLRTTTVLELLIPALREL